MAWEHRATERRQKLAEARQLVKRIMEDATACKVALIQLGLWGNPQASDFDGDEAQQQARLTETIIGIEAGQMLFQYMTANVGNYGKTIEEALLTIANP